MNYFEICVVVLMAILILVIIVCALGAQFLSLRYKRFYEKTETGKKLYCALYTKDRLGSAHDWLVNQMSELRDKINEIEFYFPDECNEKAFLHGMKVQYKEYSEELVRTKEAIADWQKRIDEMVAVLPKKYRGILEYNWELAKVEVKEESICW